MSDDQFQPVQELLALIATFSTFGKTELKVALCVSNPQPPGFKFDPPQNKGKAGFDKVLHSLVTPNSLCLVHEDATSK